MTEVEYLAFERASETKHEYFDGEVYARSGASQAHNLIVANVIAALRPQIRGKGCQIYPSDMRVHIPATRSYAYPDVTIMCGEAQFRDDQRDVLLNPAVIIEVLSESTAGQTARHNYTRWISVCRLPWSTRTWCSPRPVKPESRPAISPANGAILPRRHDTAGDRVCNPMRRYAVSPCRENHA